MLAPVLEEIAGELAGRVKVVKVNVEESRELVGQFRIMSVPTLVLLKEGKELTRITGYLPKEELLDKLESFL
jgi:thioredoxin 1